MISLREAQTVEWPIIAQITKVANDEYAPMVDEIRWRHYEEATRSTILTEPTILRFVATKNDEIVGSVIYCPPYERELNGKVVKNPYPEFRLLSVVPHFRNQGIAAELIQTCENQARLDGVDAITLHTTALMAVAKNMYDRRGYLRFSEIDFELAPGVPVLGYIKTLRENKENG